MTQKIINIGAAPDDGTGDALRTAFTKINQNAADAEERLKSFELGGGGFQTLADADAADLSGLALGSQVRAEGRDYEVVSGGEDLTLGGAKLKELRNGAGGRFKFAVLENPSGSSSNLLIRNPEPGATRIHQEPNGYVDSGTVTKYDWMFEPYDLDGSNYRIFNVYTVTGDPWGTGEGAISAINAKSTGDFWGLWPSIVFGFSDLGDSAVCAKMWYGDHNQPEHFTPNKGAWRQGKVVSAGDYVTSNNDIFKATTSGVCGAAKPSHTSGTVSDGSVSWQFVFSPHYSTVRATLMVGDRSDMPILGYPDVRAQFARNSLHHWGASQIFTDASGAEIGRVEAAGTTSNWLHIATAGGGYERYHQTDNYKQLVGLAEAAAVTVAPNGATSPSVVGVTTLEFQNTAATTISALAGGARGQRLRLVSTNGNTTIKHTPITSSGGVIRTAKGADILLNADGALDLEMDKTGGFWRVVGVGY